MAASAFVERTLISHIWPVRDLGVMLHGELSPGDESATTATGWRGLANYAMGVFNGIGDSRSAGNADFDDEKSVAGRLFFQMLSFPCLHSPATGSGWQGNGGRGMDRTTVCSSF